MGIYYTYISDPPYQRIDDVSGENFEKLLKLNIVSYFLVAKVCVIYALILWQWVARYKNSENNTFLLGCKDYVMDLIMKI